MFGTEIFQVRLEKTKQNLNRVGRIGNLEAMLVMRFVGKCQPQRDLLRDEVECRETQRQLLEKASQHEEERLGGFDLVLKLDLLREDFRRPNELQETDRFSICLLPEPDRCRPETGRELIALECGQRA